MRYRRPGVLSSLCAGAATTFAAAPAAFAAVAAPAWQIDHEIVYEGAHLDFRTATMEVAGRSHVVPAKPAAQWEEDCPGPDSIGGTCNLHARVTLYLSDAAMRDLAAAWPLHGRNKVRVRFEDAHGNAVNGKLAPDHVASLVQAHRTKTDERS